MKTNFLTVVFLSLSILSCQSIPRKNVPVIDITRNKVVKSVDLDTVQINIQGGSSLEIKAPATTTEKPNIDITNRYFQTEEPSTNSSVETRPRQPFKDGFKISENEMDTRSDNTEFEKNSTQQINNTASESPNAGYFVPLDANSKPNQLDTNINDAEKTVETIDNENDPFDNQENKTAEKDGNTSADNQTNSSSNNAYSVNLNNSPATQSLLSKAEIEIENGNYSKANSLLDRALEIKPDEPKLWYKKALTFYYMGNYRQAENMALQSNSLGPDEIIEGLNSDIINKVKAATQQTE